MATLNLLRGSIKGKLGDIVGSSWRGKEYVKTFTPPSNSQMVQINKELFHELAWDQTKLKIFEGPLFNPGITAASIQNVGTATAAVRVTFDAAIGDGTDIAIIHDEKTETTLCAQATRADAHIDILIATLDQADLTKLHAYLVFSKPPTPRTSEHGEVSTTAYLAVPPPAP